MSGPPIADVLRHLDENTRSLIDWRALSGAIERELKRVDRLREAVAMDGSQSGLMMAAGLASYADAVKEVAHRIEDRILNGGFA